MVSEKLIETAELSRLPTANEKAECIFKALTKAAQDGTLQLLHFDWVVLPTESIKLTCVTATEKKEFTFDL
jgi:hypothetical protein